jgi:hypothetical protein
MARTMPPRSADEEDSERAREPGPLVTPALFASWRGPRFGASNPERLTNPVWEWLVRSELSAYSASQHFGLESGECREPGWSFARFGRTTTMLADHRTIQIAGEHEDAYDRDFYIYTDVVLRRADGSIEIFGDPRDAFPPTDFHSASVVGDRIVIVGSLGYPSNRVVGTTQVAELDLNTLAITLRQTSGESPGWIHRHSAALTDRGDAIVISRGLVDTGDARVAGFRDNGDDWRLDLATWSWQRLTTRNWRQWQFARADRRTNHLWRVRSLSLFTGKRWAKEHRESMEAMVKAEADALRSAYGADPDLDAFAALFIPPVAHEAISTSGEEFGVHRIAVGGVTVRYVESQRSIKLVVEGVLPDETSAALVADLREKLSKIEHTPYEAREI